MKSFFKVMQLAHCIMFTTFNIFANPRDKWMKITSDKVTFYASNVGLANYIKKSLIFLI